MRDQRTVLLTRQYDRLHGASAVTSRKLTPCMSSMKLHEISAVNCTIQFRHDHSIQPVRTLAFGGSQPRDDSSTVVSMPMTRSAGGRFGYAATA